MEGKKLTPKQRLFVAEYMVDLNATQAAIRAGYRTNAAAQMGAENLTKPVIQAEIERMMDKRAESVQRTARDVVLDIERLTKQAWQEGDLKTALKGLELEGKHRGAFTERVDLTSSDGSMSGTREITIAFVDAPDAPGDTE